MQSSNSSRFNSREEKDLQSSPLRSDREYLRKKTLKKIQKIWSKKETPENWPFENSAKASK